MREENSKKLKEYLDGLKEKVGLGGFVDEDSSGEFTDIPKPQYWQEINSIVFDPDRWLIPNLIPREGVSMLASVSGEGKSWQVLHFAKCIATGSNLYGTPNFPVKENKILYINLEMSVSEIQRRGRLIGLDSNNKNLIILNEDNFNLNNMGLQDYKYRWLLDFIRREEISVLIIDTFRPTIGAMREDKSEDVRAFFQKFLILKNVGISVIFTEHLRKPTQMEGKIPKKEQVLGSQDKVSNLEVLLMLRKDDVSGETHIYQRKNRLGEEIKPFAVKLEDELGSDNRKILNFKYIGEIEDDATKKEEAKTLMLNILSSGESKTTNQLIELAKKEIGQKNVRRALAELVNQGELDMFKTGKQNTYTIPKEEVDSSPKILNEEELNNIFDAI